MTPERIDLEFTGSIPEFYERYLSPLLFAPFASDLANRVANEGCSCVLEIAAGTGVVTRALIDALGPASAIEATDLNADMIAYGKTVRQDPSATWRQADAHALPFDDGSFDAVVCQFAVMFFADRVLAISEARRVLRPGGRFIFNTWDSIAENDFARVVTDAMAEVFPKDPPRFLARTPHGYSDRDAIVRDVAAGGFSATPFIETVAARSVASSPAIPAIAFCQGTPLRNEIESRGAATLEQATEAAAIALERQFGAGEIDGKMQAHVVSVRAE